MIKVYKKLAGPFADEFSTDIGESRSKDKQCDGFFITAEELEQREREAFDAGRYGRYTRNSIVPRPLLWSEIQHDFDYKDFDDYLKQRKDETAK